MRASLRKLLRDATGGVDDAFGLVMEVSLFALIFVFAGVLIGSAAVQALSELAAHDLVAIDTTGNTTLLSQEIHTEVRQMLDTASVEIVSGTSQCSTSVPACVAVDPCSSSQPACAVTVERRVMVPVVNEPIVWSAKAVAAW